LRGRSGGWGSLGLVYGARASSAKAGGRAAEERGVPARWRRLASCAGGGEGGISRLKFEISIGEDSRAGSALGVDAQAEACGSEGIGGVSAVVGCESSIRSALSRSDRALTGCRCHGGRGAQTEACGSEGDGVRVCAEFSIGDALILPSPLPPPSGRGSQSAGDSIGDALSEPTPWPPPAWSGR
jgi:hypothetical protein